MAPQRAPVTHAVVLGFLAVGRRVGAGGERGAAAVDAAGARVAGPQRAGGVLKLVPFDIREGVV